MTISAEGKAMGLRSVFAVSVGLCAGLCAGLAAGGAMAGNVTINTTVDGVNVQTSGGNNSQVTIGGIESGDTTVQGLTIINGTVIIDGVKVPESAKEYRSKDGTLYVIKRQGGSVSVETR
jgi:hypothetical protein